MVGWVRVLGVCCGHSSEPVTVFIYLCYLALALSFSFLTSYSTMVSTHAKNKDSHPAAPVMSAVAKQKAGIKTKRCKTKATKDQTIRELQVRLEALENPSGEPFSKEPLVHVFQVGLKQDWHCTVSKSGPSRSLTPSVSSTLSRSSVPLQQVLAARARSSSSSMLVAPVRATPPQ